MLGHAHLQLHSKKVVNPSSSTQFPFQHSQFIAHKHINPTIPKNLKPNHNIATQQINVQFENS
jgi:hypothetical protein